MTAFTSKIEARAIETVNGLYDLDLDSLEILPTRKEFEGDFTIVVFPFLKNSRKGPEQTANEIGEKLQQSVEEISGFNVVKGFLNLQIADTYWKAQLEEISENQSFGETPEGDETILVEYSSPNTNKPLHLGHVRNILLGHSVAEILKADGKKTVRAQIINDRGIHICKSMLAWRKFGNGETPESSGLKGDHLVGKYYVEFDRAYRQEIEEIEFVAGVFYIFKKEEWKKEKGIQRLPGQAIEEKRDLIVAAIALAVVAISRSNFFNDPAPKKKKFRKSKSQWKEEYFFAQKESRPTERGIKAILSQKFKDHNFVSKNQYSMFREVVEELKKHSPLIQEAQELLRSWEKSDPETMALWNKLNNWVYDGFAETYLNLGVDFDKNYYESETYLLGKKVVEEGLAKNVFYKKEDASVWVDLTDEGLDEKLLLRADGTSVYITQDIGTAIQRYLDFGIQGMIYTVGNEQDYHFKVLFIILGKLGYDWAKNLYHLSYGMVDLPSGKMKSREGTVVDADDLINQMVTRAEEISRELGKTEGMSEEQKKALYHMIGMGALKYYILRVDPRKRMLFNPEESIDFQGNTGPFIQYTHARIKSLLRKGEGLETSGDYKDLHETERNIIKLLVQYPGVVAEAASGHSPAVVANYIYELVKNYNALYQQVPVLSDDNKAAVAFRLKLSEMVANITKKGMALLGIDVPERM